MIFLVDHQTEFFTVINRHAARTFAFGQFATDQLPFDEELAIEIAMELEEIALSDEYFVSRKLYPNVDFYSGIILNALGIPVNMFTVIFAIGRLPGWIAHWREVHTNPVASIDRPRQIYTGATARDYTPIDGRV